MAYQLYRHFSASGALLYVGQSVNAFERFKRHKRNAAWIEEVTEMRIENFATLKELCEAEAKAIYEEAPKYNAVQSFSDTVPPGRVQHTSIYIPTETHQKLKEIATVEGTKVHALLLEGLALVLEKRGAPWA